MMKRFVLLVIVSIVGGIAISNAQIPIPAGSWEGVIEDPVRPIVIAVDFDSASAKLDATGSSSWKIENLTSNDGKVRFQIKVRDTRYNFESSLQGSNLRGKVGIGDEVLSFWLERLPILPKPRNRVEAWQQDMDAVTNRFLRYDRSYSVRQRLYFRQRLAKLHASIGSKTDQEVTVELARIVALGGNAHTRLYLIRNRTEVRRLPIRLWWFKDELRIVRTAKEQSVVLGCTGLGNGPTSGGTPIPRTRRACRDGHLEQVAAQPWPRQQALARRVRPHR